MVSFETLTTLVEEWAEQRGIYEHSTPSAQLLKAVSEMGELADAEIKGIRTEQCDALGDVLVCLINYAHMRRINLVDALNGAYSVIKTRTGKMSAGGAFVKEQQ